MQNAFLIGEQKRKENIFNWIELRMWWSCMHEEEEKKNNAHRKGRIKWQKSEKQCKNTVRANRAKRIEHVACAKSNRIEQS